MVTSSSISFSLTSKESLCCYKAYLFRCVKLERSLLTFDICSSNNFLYSLCCSHLLSSSQYDYVLELSFILSSSTSLNCYFFSSSKSNIYYLSLSSSYVSAYLILLSSDINLLSCPSYISFSCFVHSNSCLNTSISICLSSSIDLSLYSSLVDL